MHPPFDFEPCFPTVMDPAKDEEALDEQLYNELISSGSNKRDRDASDGYVDEQEFKVREAIICLAPSHLTPSMPLLPSTAAPEGRADLQNARVRRFARASQRAPAAGIHPLCPP